jgi:hypothetical protein
LQHVLRRASSSWNLVGAASCPLFPGRYAQGVCNGRDGGGWMGTVVCVELCGAWAVAQFVTIGWRSKHPSKTDKGESPGQSVKVCA